LEGWQLSNLPAFQPSNLPAFQVSLKMTHHILAICLDCGDTLVDEGTEVKDETGASLRANLIPGAADLAHALKQRGYKLALVADGPTATFRNLLTQHQLYHLFDAFAISEQLGVEKPHPRMFQHALEQLGIAPADYSRTVMVGNNLSRDIKGANALGLISIWLDWAPRRAKVPADESEVPRYTIKTPLELLAVIDALEDA
jgi:putative hydrolase of the HAD superfamily